MKIAYLCNVYPAPTHTFIKREIRGLEQQGIQVTRFSIRRFPDKLDDAEDLTELGKTTCVLQRKIPGILGDFIAAAVKAPRRMLGTAWQACRLGFRSEAGLLKHLAYLAEACIVLNRARKDGFSHIHAHFGTNAATVAMFVDALGGPGYSFTIHGPGEWDCPEFLHIPRKVHRARFVAVISHFARSQTFRWTDPGDWAKVHVIRCGVDERYVRAVPTPVPDVSRLIMIGRFGRSKGHLVLLEALERLLETRSDFHMRLIGDGPLRGRIQQETERRRLQNHVEITGWMDNNSIRTELLRCRALVLPSFGEGLPVVIMESLALARPAVCTRIAGISELVVDRENGWLVNAGDPDELAAALREVLQTPVNALSRMGAAGREAVLAKHDSAAEAARLAGLLQHYCRTGQAGP